MPPGDERRRLVRIMAMLREWRSPGTLSRVLHVDRSTVHRALREIHRESGLERRKTGWVVEYRLVDRGPPS
jgi:predicted transcriptional regulator